MERRISEPDWQVLRELEPVARDRFCQRILSEVVRCATGTSAGSHDRYLAVFRLIEEQDRELGAAFDGLRRSTALVQLARMRVLGLLTDQEFGRFSNEAQRVVALFSGVFPS